MKLSQIYLLIYNVVQVFGWSIILGKTSVGLLNGASPMRIYKSVAFELEIFQTAAFLEVIHCMFGLVRSPVMTTFTQVFSRLMITWPVVHRCTQAQSTIGVCCFLFAWSLTEVIRYSFYGLSLLGAVPYVISWLRYTLFIVLYPLGVVGELLAVYAALPQIKRERVFAFDMPNRYNIAFDYGYALILFAVMYIPVFPQLYFYMFAQRRKVIGGEGKTDKKEA